MAKSRPSLSYALAAFVFAIAVFGVSFVVTRAAEKQVQVQAARASTVQVMQATAAEIAARSTIRVTIQGETEFASTPTEAQSYPGDTQLEIIPLHPAAVDIPVTYAPTATADAATSARAP